MESTLLLVQDQNILQNDGLEGRHSLTDGFYLFWGKMNSLKQVGNIGEDPGISKQKLNDSELLKRCRNYHLKNTHAFICNTVHTDPHSFSNDLFYSRKYNQQFWSSAAFFKHLCSLFSSLRNNSLMFYRQNCTQKQELCACSWKKEKGCKSGTKRRNQSLPLGIRILRFCAEQHFCMG